MEHITIATFYAVMFLGCVSYGVAAFYAWMSTGEQDQRIYEAMLLAEHASRSFLRGVVPPSYARASSTAPATLLVVLMLIGGRHPDSEPYTAEVWVPNMVGEDSQVMVCYDRGDVAECLLGLDVIDTDQGEK